MWRTRFLNNFDELLKKMVELERRSRLGRRHTVISQDLIDKDLLPNIVKHDKIITIEKKLK